MFRNEAQTQQLDFRFFKQNISFKLYYYYIILAVYAIQFGSEQIFGTSPIYHHKIAGITSKKNNATSRGMILNKTEWKWNKRSPISGTKTSYPYIQFRLKSINLFHKASTVYKKRRNDAFLCAVHFFVSSLAHASSFPPILSVIRLVRLVILATFRTWRTVKDEIFKPIPR